MTNETAEKNASMNTDWDEATSYAITDEDIERAKKLTGIFEPKKQRQYVTTASHDALRNFAIGVGDDNPLYCDEDYGKSTRWGGQIGTPLMMQVMDKPMLGDRMDDEFKRNSKSLFRGIHVFVSGGEWKWYRPIYAGDTIYSLRGQSDLLVKPSEFAGRTVTRMMMDVKINQRGELVGTNEIRMILSERKKAREKGKYSQIEPASYSAEDIARIDEIYAAEQARGGEPRWWEDVQVGDSLGTMAKGPLTPTDIIVYHAGGYGFAPYMPCSHRIAWQNRQRIPAFYTTNGFGVPEPAQRVHWDAEFARETTGNPLAYDYGVMRESWFSHYLTDWHGDDGFIVRMYDEIRKFNYMGDVQYITGEVTAKREQDGNHVVDIVARMTSQRGEVSFIGEATIALPSRAAGPVRLPSPPDELQHMVTQKYARHCELAAEKRKKG